MIELGDGVFVQPALVAVVKKAGDGKCAIFTAGQSATDGGFVIDEEAVEVAEKIDNALDED
jgi:hypothetical protein